MAKSLAVLIVLLTVLPPAVCRAQEEGKPSKSALGAELEGLEPPARIAYLEYLLTTRPGDPEVYFQLGIAFQDESKPDSAMFYYRKAVEADPRFSKAYVNMGVLLDGERKSAEALAAFEKAAEVNPDDVLAQSHAAYMLFQRAEYDQAWNHLSEALEADSLDPQPHFYLAVFFWESGIYREALNEWEKVVNLAPGSYLAERAEENIDMLQHVLTSPSDRGRVKIDR